VCRTRLTEIFSAIRTFFGICRDLAEKISVRSRPGGNAVRSYSLGNKKRTWRYSSARFFSKRNVNAGCAALSFGGSPKNNRILHGSISSLLGDCFFVPQESMNGATARLLDKLTASMNGDNRLLTTNPLSLGCVHRPWGAGSAWCCRNMEYVQPDLQESCVCTVPFSLPLPYR
jgi:hypothetical protein